jgi:hypothetical protein
MPTAIAAAADKKRRSEIPFVNFAILDRIPDPDDTLELSDHLFPYEGCAVDKSEFIWGIYGTTSKSSALFMAEQEATRKHRKTLLIQGTYLMENYDLSVLTDSHTVRKSGFVNMSRLKLQFREELKEYLLGRAAARYPKFNRDLHSKESVTDLMLAYPSLVNDVFEFDKKVTMVVHPVRPSWNPNERRDMSVCTMRRNLRRIVDVNVRFLSQVRVKV